MTWRAIAAGLMLAAGGVAHGSTCFGTPENGRLEDGVSLPLSGDNFQAYSPLGWMLGRAHVHDRVHAALLGAWQRVETGAPATTFVYGETGWPGGGAFPPHKTHRNGTSVDFMVPVRRDGKPATLPANASNRFGYDLHFDEDGRMGDYAIDFEAIAEHLFALHAAAHDAGIGIRRVIFEVPLQRHLFRTVRGAWLRDNIWFSHRQAWVRHDEHYHVDFAVSCQPLR